MAMRVAGLLVVAVLAACEAKAPAPVELPAPKPAAVLAVSADVSPGTPLIETRTFGQALNFDLRLHNTGNVPLTLRAIQMTVRNRAGEVVQVSEINDNGPFPGIEAVTQRTVPAGESVSVFNPLYALDREVEAAALDYHLSFVTEDGAEIATDLHVAPEAYATKTPLRLPLNGRVLVWDGHDFYAHHRRLSLDAPPASVFGLKGNANRYSYDFVLADAAGKRFRTDGKAFEDHFSFGVPVLAPGDGVVVAAVDDQKDGGEMSEAMLKANLMSLFGNHVVIDHGNGEFSRMGHLKAGSVAVKVGQRVKAGEVVGAVGSSGSSLFPHLHYELARGADMATEGLPSTFRNLDRVLGSKRVKMDGVSPDSGEIIADRSAALGP